MTSSFPATLDTCVNPVASDALNSSTVPHAAQHDNINDAVLAIETALGANLANVVLPARSISTTAPLTGGGGLSANRTLSLNIGSSLTTSSSNLIVDSTVVPYLANANTFTASPQQITVNAATNNGLIIKGAASQTANLQEWQNSAGGVLASVQSNGKFYIGDLESYGSVGVGIVPFTSSAILAVATGATVNKGLIIKGSASQTANLQEWQDSAGTVLASITAAGIALKPQPTPNAQTASATLTVANLLTQIVTSTSATAVALTLPTGTLMDGGFATPTTDTAFDWSVINLGSALGAVTMTAGTAHTYVGNATVAINTSALFRSRRTAATTWVTYRIS